MKTFNTKLTVALFTTLILTGCMPDSLTKFKKDAPKKEATTTTPGDTNAGPVVDESGAPVTFDEPTYFSFGALDNPKEFAVVDSTLATSPLTDGSLGDPSKASKFFERCDLVTTGVNAQATVLPTGVSFSSTTCSFIGTPKTPKSIMTEYCSDGSSADQATCEANPLVWNSTTGTCSLPDLKYATQGVCTASFHKWYAVGDPIPYRVKLTYHNSQGVQKSIYSRYELGTYKKLTSLSYTQSDKLLLKVSGGTGLYAAITPLLTSTATTGSYPRNSVITSSLDVAGIAKYVDSTLNLIGVNKLIPIKVNSTTPFIVNTFISKSGDATKIGRIFKIDVGNRLLYVENISANNKTFAISENICSNTITGVCGTSYAILDINKSYVYKKDQLLDNDKQYYAEKFKVDTPTNVYEVGSTINPLLPIASTEITATNGIEYSISPALPCNNPADPTDCISLNKFTGAITGTFSSFLTNTDFTLTATNPVGSITTIISLGAIVGPGDVALTNKQIITVSSTASFTEGETIYQPLAPPLTEALNAKVIKILNSYQMAIETFNGEFAAGASLDSNGSAYKSEKAIIIPYNSCVNSNYITQTTCETAGYVWSPSSTIHYNVALTTNSTGDYLAGDYVTAAAGTGLGATGLVAHVLTAANDILFVQYLTQTATSTSAAKTFYEGDTLNLGTVVITQVESPFMKFTLADASTFTKGSDVVTSASAAGYIYNKSGNILSVTEISRASFGTFLKSTQTIYNHETVALSTGNSTIDPASVTFDNYFVFERGKNMTLKGNISDGNGIIYSISPALPTGLVLDTKTGSITGSATSTSARKDYIITGTNFIGSSSNVIALEVRDYFEIQEKSGAASFIMHKVGDYQNNRRCRVDSTDIASLSNGKALDIRCFLDGEEQDVFQSDIVFKELAGPGICEYVQYAPYYFNAWSPAQSFETSQRYPSQTVTRTGCTDVTNTGSIPTADMCEGNYSYYDRSFPNCDEGTLSYYSETYDTTCAITSRTKVTISCGGDKSKCIAGPVRDVINDTGLKNGQRVQIASAIAGINKSYTHPSPITKGDTLINIRNANGTVNNQCLSSAADALTWKAKAVATSKLASPMGSDSNPFYTFTCLNAAYEIKARIRIIVRDWDETFKISNNIYNQSFTAPASQMNNSGIDPIFGELFNNKADWDDDTFYRSKPTFTGGSCGTHNAGSCTTVNANFESDAQCLAVGGSVFTPAACANPAYTSKVTCEFAGLVWSYTGCKFSNQYQCNLYGGTWTGDEEYKFPNGSFGNFLGL